MSEQGFALVFVNADDGECEVFWGSLEETKAQLEREERTGWIYRVPEHLKVDTIVLSGKTYIYELFEERELVAKVDAKGVL